MPTGILSFEIDHWKEEFNLLVTSLIKAERTSQSSIFGFSSNRTAFTIGASPNLVPRDFKLLLEPLHFAMHNRYCNRNSWSKFRANEDWSHSDYEALKVRFGLGQCDELVGEALGRSEQAIRSRYLRLVDPKYDPDCDPKNPGATFSAHF